MADPELTFGYSPCPNDTFAFHALTHGLVDDAPVVQASLDDIESLNRRARQGEFELTKLSIGALASLQDRYVPLRSGAALGRGVGPLVVARSEMTLESALAGTIAIPGRATTAYLLLQLAAAELPRAPRLHTVELRYDEIVDAVTQGTYDAGLVIHESRFTYQHHGLERVADLGELWEQRTGMPVPLAVICARSDVESGLRRRAERAIRTSVEFAFANPQASADYVRAHAQEMSADVCRQHIDLYVNEFSIDIGEEGSRAIDALIAAAHR